LRAGFLSCVAALCVTLSSSPATADMVEYVLVADRLVADQVGGTWPGEEWFTGSIAAGLVRAYEQTHNPAYKVAAEAAGTYMIAAEAGNYYGDSAYALTRLSQINDDPADNDYRDAATGFYDVLWAGNVPYFIDDIVANAWDAGTAAFYVAHHVLAAYNVDAVEKEEWRDGLMDILALVTDDNDIAGPHGTIYPVQALGLGVWALAATGNDALIPDLNPLPTGTSPLAGMTLDDLMEFLLTQQVPAGEPGAGGFYWRFDHAGITPPVPGLVPGNAAFMEDTVYGVLGLMSAYDATGDPRYSAGIDLGRALTTTGIDENGVVYAHCPPAALCPTYYVYSPLQIMSPEPGTLALFAMGSYALSRHRRRRRRDSR